MGKKNILQNLTKNLVNYIINSNSSKLYIKKTARDLNTQIRRLYDVLNIFEGLGLIYKSTNYVFIQNEFYKLYSETYDFNNIKEKRNISPIPIQEFNLNIFNYN